MRKNKNLLNSIKRKLDRKNYYKKKKAGHTKAQHTTKLTTGNLVLKTNLTEQVKKEAILLQEEGIFLQLGNIHQQGYLYYKNYAINRFGTPKAHLVACQAIQKQKKKGYLKGNYYWNNIGLAKLVHKETSAVPRANLEICKYCVKALEKQGENPPRDTATFEAQQRLFNKKYYHPTLRPIKVGSYGYSSNWSTISRKYRASKNYTCQKCQFSIQDKKDRKYIHVDHIDGNKLNNQPKNLQVLCILCHSQKDALHKRNFSKGSGRLALNQFLRKHKPHLL